MLPQDGDNTSLLLRPQRPRLGFVTSVTLGDVGVGHPSSYDEALPPVEDCLSRLRRCCCHHCRIRRNHFATSFHFAFCLWDMWCSDYKSLCTALELSPTLVSVFVTPEWLWSSAKYSNCITTDNVGIGVRRTYKIIDILIVGEKGLSFASLVLDESLNI